ncbi:hypothetical protein JYU10_00680 [bacterium AH-315-J04]|nr:hypothetical protein [bacterium AH-315-J04]
MQSRLVNLYRKGRTDAPFYKSLNNGCHVLVAGIRVWVCDDGRFAFGDWYFG